MNKNDLKRIFRSGVLKQQAYAVNLPAVPVKLNQNESPWDWPPELKAKLTENLLALDWNRYPPLSQEELQAQVGAWDNQLAANVVLGNGSNEILQALFSVTLESGDRIGILQPTFGVYQLLAERYGATTVPVAVKNDFNTDISVLIENTHNCKLLVIPNPNSPTGRLIELTDLEPLIAQTPGLIVIDEAYVEFSGVTAAGLIDRYPQLVVTRTLSKAAGLAGIRAGYALAQPQVAEQIRKGLMPFNLDIFTGLAFGMVIKNRTLIAERAGKIITQRDQLINAIRSLPAYQVWDSRSNFFLVKPPIPANEFISGLLNKGILVRDVSKVTGGCVRITVGTPEQNAVLLTSLKEIRND